MKWRFKFINGKIRFVKQSVSVGMVLGKFVSKNKIFVVSTIYCFVNLKFATDYIFEIQTPIWGCKAKSSNKK